MYIAMYLNNRDCHCNFNDKTCNIEILICRLESSVLCFFFYKNFIHRSLRYMVDMNVKKKARLMPLIFLLFTLNSTSKTLIICLTDKYV